MIQMDKWFDGRGNIAELETFAYGKVVARLIKPGIGYRNALLPDTTSSPDVLYDRTEGTPEDVEQWLHQRGFARPPAPETVVFAKSLYDNMITITKAEYDALVKDAERMRRWDATAKRVHGVPCACEFEEDGETIIRWCSAHATLRDKALEGTLTLPKPPTDSNN